MADDKKFDTSRLSPDIKKQLAEDYGIAPSYLRPYEGDLPYTQYGLDSRNQGIASVRNLESTNLLGVTHPAKDVPGGSFIGIDPTAPPTTVGHEIEHALMHQGLPPNENINTMWDKLIFPDGKKGYNKEDEKSAVVKRLVEHAPYLQEEWGLTKDHPYFSQKMLKVQGSRYPYLLQEQLATLSPLEQKLNKSLTEDPYVQKYILTTPAQRETYNALTGLRQSRLDAKDLPPYTRQPEPEEPGMFSKALKAIGFKAGGFIDKPVTGGKKLI
jgi:hypothetical protein